MAGICCGVVGESDTSAQIEPKKARLSRRRRMEIQRLTFVATPLHANNHSTITSDVKRRKVESPLSSPSPSPSPREHQNAAQSSLVTQALPESGELLVGASAADLSSCAGEPPADAVKEEPKFGMTSVCGRRRDMEDAVSLQPAFWKPEGQINAGWDFYGVYDGHGCSHVAEKCRALMHQIVGAELNTVDVDKDEEALKQAMGRSFSKMDEEARVSRSRESIDTNSSSCRCELQLPQCDAVGSTALVSIVTADKIVISNCGDSRAVLCRSGVAVPLTSDHKPDRPDELKRIEEAGGRVIYWDGPRVLGVLAMSRAIGDNYLKPYVIPDPEVTVLERSEEDECLILASDGLWDVVSNETACGVARMCLRSGVARDGEGVGGVEGSGSSEGSDKSCMDASILLTKLALARQSSDNVSVVVVDLKRDRHC
uniref:protein-serine/threonine phosphatase n=1 Tax=Kalanchoe fedtschenkoi TaxID=63787 RepID=A0A7N1A4V8_KALFE